MSAITYDNISATHSLSLEHLHLSSLPHTNRKHMYTQPYPFPHLFSVLHVLNKNYHNEKEKKLLNF